MATQLAVSSPWSNSVWFFSGLLALALNRQLLEPYFPRPVDSLANSIVGLLLVAVADKSVATPGWWAAGALFVVVGGLSLSAQLLGQGGSKARRLGQAARRLTARAGAVSLYSVLFFLDLLENFEVGSGTFWILAIGWILVAVIGSVDWEAAWTSYSFQSPQADVVGFVGPSRLIITSTELPRPGARVELRSSHGTAEGVVVRRIRRMGDVYGEVFLPQEEDPEAFLTQTIELRNPQPPGETVGVVDHGSTDRTLRFVATGELAVGDAVFVHQGERELIYQISSAEIRRHDDRDGAELETVCMALQLGRWDPDLGRIDRHPWVAPPGFAVTARSHAPHSVELTAGHVRLGTVVGSDIPIHLDLDHASSGHLLILGMTKMGKSTLAIGLARALAGSRPVAILDQTGEYRTRHEIPVCTADALSVAGLSLKEPKKGEIGPIVARDFFAKLLDQMASEEYESKKVQARTILVEEAHQFLPEPSGLGFGTPGRDEAYELGTMMMQIRKYGLSVVLISQRTAVVGKSAISQCENIIAFRSVDRTGLDYLEGIMGREAVGLLPRLRQGQAIVAGPAFNADNPVAVQVEAPVTVGA